jgi:tetratricopeptide (TPR) repeat protein
MRLVVLAALLCLAAPLSAAENLPPNMQPAPDPDLRNPNRTYQACLALARTNPEKSIELAGKWVGLGGGEPARHCQALSLVGLKEYGEGATRLEEIAVASQQEATVRASMLAQAGQAWLMQGDPTRAYAAQTLALKIVPQGSKQHMEILIDRAGTLADAGKYKEVIVDVDKALNIDPSNATGWAFRAAAHRYLGDEDEALQDAENAVKVGPTNQAALLERGNLYRMKKRLADARKDWLKILEIDPDTAAADSARLNIEHMDVDPHAK